jgi:hypothetical protein
LAEEDDHPRPQNSAEVEEQSSSKEEKLQLLWQSLVEERALRMQMEEDYK